ncbi:MAG TPA: transglutaminase family protein [Rhabdochlamydiaceae bacterium]|nr:transglutaminase family protein [Rhabdochlamydiaceae bacterium]
MFSVPLFPKQKEKSPDKTNPSLRSLYNSLDPFSILQHLSFYELYPETSEGKKAISHVWELLHQGQGPNPITLPSLDIQSIISIITRQPFDPPVKLNEEQLATVENISKSLTNRKLKGFEAWSKEEILALPSRDIDLARGLLINQFDTSENMRDDVRQYEASLDLMALQILVRLPINATPEDKIREINRFIFQEMQFRFPPHSLYAKDIDLYTFLPSVLDSRQGVCLGVSILYLCLAQRLDLDLEIITPPGHIYLRYPGKEQMVNIETTARGINLPSDTYLGINTRKLEKRTLKEVIGMAFFNQASVYWEKGDYAATVSLYEKALPYLPGDPLLKMLLGMNYLFVDKKSEGKKLLEEIRDTTFDYAVSPETIPADYLKGKVDAEGLKTVFLHVDETRASIVEKQKKLQKILSKYPSFRAGLLHLAITWIQLGRGREAQEILEKYHKIDPGDSVVEYYLAILCMERMDYNRSWFFLKRSESITQAREHKPKALKEIRNHLRRICPE